MRVAQVQNSSYPLFVYHCLHYSCFLLSFKSPKEDIKAAARPKIAPTTSVHEIRSMPRMTERTPVTAAENGMMIATAQILPSLI